MSKKNCNKTTPIKQAEIIPFPSTEKTPDPTKWLDKITRLHKDDHKQFRIICGLAHEFAKETKNNTNKWDDMMQDMKSLEKDPYWLGSMQWLKELKRLMPLQKWEKLFPSLLNGRYNHPQKNKVSTQEAKP